MGLTAFVVAVVVLEREIGCVDYKELGTNGMRKTRVVSGGGRGMQTRMEMNWGMWLRLLAVVGMLASWGRVGEGESSEVWVSVYMQRGEGIGGKRKEQVARTGG